MKILIDCIYTQDVGHCASSAKMRTIVEYVLGAVPDTFFYWLIPDRTTDEEAEWLPKDDRIKYIRYPYSNDRLKEYMRFYKELEYLIAFNGICWDVDMVITNRTSMVANMKAVMNKVGREGLNWSKKVFLIEDMPIMEYKKLLPLAHAKCQSLQTLTGYMTADVTAISSFWQKNEILIEGRNYLSPSQLDYIRGHMIESTSMKILETGLKKKEHIEPLLKKERPFTMAYTGRMTASQTRIPEILSVMEKNWILKSGANASIRCLVSTVSQNTAVVSYNGERGLPDWCEFHRPSREEFWRLFKEEVDVYLFMSKEEDYSMSLMEPLVRGCPAVLIRDKWSIGTVGEDYPFFVSEVNEAYVMVKRFHDDYAGMYKVFAEWSRTRLTPLLHKRNENYICDLVVAQMDQWKRDFVAHNDKYRIDAQNEIVNLIASHGGEDLVIEQVLAKLDEDGVLRHLARKLDPEWRNHSKMVFSTDWNYFRLGLIAKGYRDGGVTVGHMKLGAV